MVRVAQKGCSISILGDTQTWLDMAMSNLLWLTAGSWGGGWTAPFPQANPSPPGIRWLCDAWTCWICMDISVYISIKLQSYYVHHFPVQDLLSLIVGSGEKWGGGRAFPTAWLLADIITLTLVTECFGRGNTQSQWLQGNSLISRKARRNSPGRLAVPQVPTAGFLITALMHFIRWIIHAGCWAGVTTVYSSLTVALVQAFGSKINSVLTAHSLSTSPSEMLLVSNSSRKLVDH